MGLRLKTSNLSPGDLVDGRYRVVRALGQGAFGSTYLVEQAQLGGRLVLKVSRASPGANLHANQQFQREAEVRRRINNRNVADLVEYAQLADGRPYLVTEWVDGPSVREFLRKRGPLQLIAALDVAHAVAQALEAAHAVGIIHRDIKPENVILPEDAAGVHFDDAKLVDFGVLGELSQDSNSTQAGQMFGTPTYMSPEQLRGQSQTPAADIYGLGMLLYEMIYGRPAFTAENIETFFLKVFQENVPFPPTPEIPKNITSFMEKCLSKNWEARPQSARLVITELKAFLSSAKAALVKAEANRPSVLQSVQPPPLPAGSPLPAPTASQVAPSGVSSQPQVIPARIAAKRNLLVPGLILSASGVGFCILAMKGRNIPPEARGLMVGVLLILGGIAMGLFLHRWLGYRKTQIERETEEILQGAKTRVSLTESIALEVEELFRRCKQMDERIFAATMALMLKEYEAAKESDNRQAALMNIIQITDKLMDRLCPWYVKHEKVVAFIGSAVGVISGAASATESFMKILGKH